MEKTIYDEKNGLSYSLGDDGMYYPDLSLGEEDYNIGKYGLLREEYLKNYRLGTYNRLLMTGKLNDHLHELDLAAQERVEELVGVMAQVDGTNEDLKATDQMEWVCRMNNYRLRAEEVVFNELLYI